MYICTVVCCAVGTTDQAAAPGSGTVRCLLIQDLLRLLCGTGVL